MTVQFILAFSGVIYRVSQHYYGKEPRYLSQYNNGLWAGRPGLDSRHGQYIFLFPTVSKPSLGDHPASYRMGTEELKRPGRDPDHSSPSNAEVENGGAPTPITHTPSQFYLLHLL